MSDPMENEMVERCARALMDIELKLPGAGGVRGTIHLAPAQAREFARVVIAALREPTEGMLYCNAETADGFVPYPETCRVTWQAMIDAALTP